MLKVVHTLSAFFIYAYQLNFIRTFLNNQYLFSKNSHPAVNNKNNEKGNTS